MPLRDQDRAVWIGAGEIRPVGSSGKVLKVWHQGSLVRVGWGGGSESVCIVDREVVTPRQAANKGIEPWAKAFVPRPARDKSKPYNPPRIV